MVSTRRQDSKVQWLSERLRTLALEKGPLAKLPTSRELSKLFATSRETVNAALDILEDQNIIYRKQGSGIYVSPKVYRKSICVLFYADLFLSQGSSPFWGIFWTLFAREMESRSASLDQYYTFHLVLKPSKGELALPEDVIALLQAQKVHGILAVGLKSPTFEWLVAQGTPSVTFGGLGTAVVASDHFEEARIAVTQLVEQGCRNIGLWVPRSDNAELWQENEHYQGFLATSTELGIDIQHDLIRISSPVTEAATASQHIPTLHEQGYQFVLDVFDNPDPTAPRPDGLFIVNDMMTAGALAAFRALDIHVGEEIKVATLANAGSPILFGDMDKMVLIEFDPAELVQTMFTLLDEILAEERKEALHEEVKIVTIRSKLRTVSQPPVARRRT